MVLYRAEADLQPWSRRWWDHYRVAVSSCVMVVENGQAREQTVASAPFPSRLLHDPRFTFRRWVDQSVTDHYFEITITVQGAARDGVSSSGVDYIDEDEATWSTITSSGTIIVDPDVEVETGDSVYDALAITPRSDWDDPGTIDFVRLRMRAVTTGSWTGTIRVESVLFGNQGVLKQDYINAKLPVYYPAIEDIDPIVPNWNCWAEL